MQPDTNTIAEESTMKKNYFAYYKMSRVTCCRIVMQLGLAAVFLVMAGAARHTDAAEPEKEKTLIVFYSRTGNSSVVADVLKDHLQADTLRIREHTDRSGTLGFWGAALDSFLNRQADIEPAQPDLSGYKNIIVVSPIWNWNLCVPIRTLLQRTDFQGKRLVVFTTANIDIKKYEPYGDDAPFVKRFFRDYLRKKSLSMREVARSSGAEIRGHFHIATKGISKKKIRAETLGFIEQVQYALSLPVRHAHHIARNRQ